ncbi:hypothetical protein O181_069883 [Austropuccinia psidii MF-1]|uniref:Chromo domain-containing protein n=1 Tax=Austropuccinia psidii MF-1 TaxID=1389203 RepID=A0A9Q3I6R9_9BASI|nr:hypothetical protein [Austropuccinia psidii MF-1]
MNIHPTAKEIHDIWKRACDTAARCIAEPKEYNEQRWEKSNMEPDFEEGYQVLVSTLNFKNLKGPKKMRDSLLGPFTIIKLTGKMQWRSNPLRNFLGNTQYYLPVSLVKPYFRAVKDKFPSWKKNPTQPEIVEVEEFPGSVKKIIKARKIRLNDKYQRQYLVRFKNQTADKEKWLAEDAIPDV